MQDIFPSLDGLFLGLPGHYSIALTTLLLCVLTALYFANFFKDKTVCVPQEERSSWKYMYEQFSLAGTGGRRTRSR